MQQTIAPGGLVLFHPHQSTCKVCYSLLGVCVVSYNKLRRHANATKLDSNLLTISKKVPARRRMLVLTSHRFIPTDRSKYTSSHSVLGVCVVSYNKLRRHSNATNLGSNLPTISKKVPARRRMLVLTSHRFIPTDRSKYTSSHSVLDVCCQLK